MFFRFRDDYSYLQYVVYLELPISKYLPLFVLVGGGRDIYPETFRSRVKGVLLKKMPLWSLLEAFNCVFMDHLIVY